MTLQIRPKAGSGEVYDVAYNPARDIAYLYPNIVQMAETMLYEGRHKLLHEWLDCEEVDPDDLAKTIRAFCETLNAAHQNPDETLEDIMERTGFADCPQPLQVALMYYIGTMMAGTFFKGLRDVVRRGDDTTPEVRRLAAMGARMADYTARGRLGRWWIRFKRKWSPIQPWFTIGGKPA